MNTEKSSEIFVFCEDAKTLFYIRGENPKYNFEIFTRNAHVKQITNIKQYKNFHQFSYNTNTFQTTQFTNTTQDVKTMSQSLEKTEN